MAEPAPTEQTAKPASPAKIAIKKDDGSIGYVKPENLAKVVEQAKLLGGKVTVASPDDLQADKYDKEYGGLKGQAIAGLVGLGEGPGLGIPNVIAAELGGKEARTAMRESVKRNEGTKTVTEIGGLLLPGAGEAGLFGDALKGVSEASGLGLRAVEGLGHGAEHIAQKIVGEGATSLLGKVAQRAIPSAAKFGAENAAFGVGSALSEAAINDEPITYEKMLAAGGSAAMVGSILGGGLGGLGAVGRAGAEKLFGKGAKALDGAAAHAGEEGLGKAARGAEGATPAVEGAVADTAGLGTHVPTAGLAAEPTAAGLEGVAKATFGDAAPGVGAALAKGEKAENFADKAAKLLADTSDPQGAKGYADFYTKRNALKAGFAEEKNQLVVDARGAVNKVLDTDHDFKTQIYGPNKKMQMGHLVPEENLHLARQATTDAYGDLLGAIENSTIDARANGQEAKLIRLGKIQENFAAKLGKINSAADHMNILDDLQRQLQPYAKVRNNNGELGDLAKNIQELYKNNISRLTNEATFGPGALAQKEMNALTKQVIDHEQFLMPKISIQSGTEDWLPKYVADPQKLSTALSDITNPRKGLFQDNMNGWIQSKLNLLDAGSKHYTFDAATTAKVAEQKAALNELKATFGKASENAAKMNQVKLLQSEGDARRFGGVLGGAFDLLTNPVKTLQFLGRVSDMTNKVGTRVTDGVGDFLSGAHDFAHKESIKHIALHPGLVGLKAAGEEVAHEGSKHGHAEGVSMHEAKGVADAMAHPGDGTEHIAAALGHDIPSTAGSLHTGTAMALSAMYQNIAANAPKNRAQPNLLQADHQPPSRYSDVEISKFANYLHGAKDPVSVFDDMKAGKLPREKVQAVKENYPHLYQEMQTKLLDGLASHPNALTYEKKQQMSILFGIPLDHTQAPEFASFIQSSKTPPQPQGTGGGEKASGHSSRAIKGDSFTGMTTSEGISHGRKH